MDNDILTRIGWFAAEQARNGLVYGHIFKVLSLFVKDSQKNLLAKAFPFGLVPVLAEPVIGLLENMMEYCRGSLSLRNFLLILSKRLLKGVAIGGVGLIAFVLLGPVGSALFSLATGICIDQFFDCGSCLTL
jgi:hypothetical protein